MLLTIRHQTRFSYSDEIADTAMELRVKPVEDRAQAVRAYVLAIEPRAPVRTYLDMFGNVVSTYNHRPPHRSVTIDARSTVETMPHQEEGPPPALSPSERFQLTRHDGPVSDTPGVRAIAERYGVGQVGRPMLTALTEYVHDTFRYQSNVTNVESTAADLLALGSGVCQDFAHLWIAVCRCNGVPARYVSGYLYTGDANQPQASHAWAEAWLVEAGWVGFDPTNARAAVGEGHVRLAVGRDYRDVPPTRGVFRGTATERLVVDVRVERVDAVVGARSG